MGYESGKIYRIQCGEHYYFGSCITSLSRRAITHRYQASKGKKDSRLYRHIRGNEWTITLVCDCPCSSKAELLAKEDEYVRPSLGDALCLNERSATLDVDKAKSRGKKWYQENKERICAKLREKYALHHS